MTLKDAILKKIMDWAEAETGLGFGQVIPVTESDDESGDGPAPEVPFIMVDLGTLNEKVGGPQPEQWHEDDGSGGIQLRKLGRYKAPVTLNAYGRSGPDYLHRLALNTGSIDTLSIRPIGPINDFSQIAKRTHRESRHQRDFEIQYGLLAPPDTDPVELETVEVNADYGDDFTDSFVIDLTK